MVQLFPFLPFYQILLAPQMSMCFQAIAWGFYVQSEQTLYLCRYQHVEKVSWDQKTPDIYFQVRSIPALNDHIQNHLCLDPTAHNTGDCVHGVQFVIY